MKRIPEIAETLTRRKKAFNDPGPQVFALPTHPLVYSETPRYLRWSAGVSRKEIRCQRNLTIPTSRPAKPSDSPAEAAPTNFTYGITNLETRRLAQGLTVTFPDGAHARIPPRHHRSRHRQGHLALARQRTVAMALDGVIVDLAERHRARRQDRIHQPRRSARAELIRRTTPPMCWPKRCRSCGPARR